MKCTSVLFLRGLTVMTYRNLANTGPTGSLLQSPAKSDVLRKPNDSSHACARGNDLAKIAPGVLVFLGLVVGMLGKHCVW